MNNRRKGGAWRYRVSSYFLAGGLYPPKLLSRISGSSPSSYMCPISFMMVLLPLNQVTMHRQCWLPFSPQRLTPAASISSSVIKNPRPAVSRHQGRSQAQRRSRYRCCSWRTYAAQGFSTDNDLLIKVRCDLVTSMRIRFFALACPLAKPLTHCEPLTQQLLHRSYEGPSVQATHYIRLTEVASSQINHAL